MQKTNDRKDLLKYFSLILVFLSASFLILVSDKLQDTGNIVSSSNTNIPKGNAMLTINTNPSSATLDIGGGKSMTTPATLILLPGKYHFKIIKTGYKNEEFDITLIPGDKQNIRKTLKKLSLLNINSDPEKASVYLDNQLIGTTPLTHYLSQGSYNLRINKNGHDVYSTTVNVNRENNDLNVQLIQNAGIILNIQNLLLNQDESTRVEVLKGRLNPSPQGQQYFYDGQVYAKNFEESNTIESVELEPGRYKIEAAHIRPGRTWEYDAVEVVINNEDEKIISIINRGCTNDCGRVDHLQITT